MKSGLCLLTQLFATVAFATPTVSNVRLSQSSSRLVTVQYDLDEAGLVTATFETNCPGGGWAPIGADCVVTVAGDLNRLVDAGKDRQFTWKARKDWPGQRIANGFRVTVKAWNAYAPPKFMALDLANPGRVVWYEDAEAMPSPGISSRLFKTRFLLFRRIPAAGVRWRAGKLGARNSNRSQYKAHFVTLTSDYYMGVYELTRRQFQYLTGIENQSGVKRDGEDWEVYPAEDYTFSSFRGDSSKGYNWPTDGHAVAHDSALGKLREWFRGMQFDFPTVAQWEFAARAGCEADSPSPLDECGWGVANWKQDPALKKNGPHAVGLLNPNGFDLYDTIGNVMEYCLDWMSENEAVAAGAEVVDPTGPDAKDSISELGNGGRTWAGGSWEDNNSWAYPRSFSSRYTWGSSGSPNVGFRLCCPAEIK